jgi:hypothetical protein
MTMFAGSSPVLRLDDGAIVGRVRVRAAGVSDAASLRRRVEAALGGDALRPAGLPASAVLCIRALRDPRPGALVLAANLRPPAQWERALQGEIERAVRCAVRPIEGGTTAGAAAVLFRNRAELLACLAKDWVRGEVHANWWWSHLVRPGAGGRIAPAQWTADAPYVPAAARCLAELGEIASFARALHRREAVALVSRMVEAFGLDWGFRERVGVEEGARAQPERDSEETKDGDRGARWESAWRVAPGGAHPRFAGDADVLQWVPEAASEGVTGASRAFVALSLMLARIPAAARQGPVPGTIARLAMEATAGESGAGSRAAYSGTQRQAGAEGEAPIEAGPATREASPAPAARPSHRDTRLAEPIPPRAEASSWNAVHAPAGASPASGRETSASDDRRGARTRMFALPPAPQGGPPTSRGEDAIAGPFRSEGDSPPGRAALPAQSQEPLGRSGQVSQVERDHPFYDADIVTQYGGVFFLLNVLLALGIYGDFTSPRLRLVKPSPWALLSRMARQLLGDTADERDALWPLFPRLAGGVEDDESWPSEWRVLPEWLDAFPERERWRWCHREGRLRIWHPSGFAVLDVAVAGDPEAQLAREAERYLPTSFAQSAEDCTGADWPELLASFVRARIHRAIRASDPDASVERVARLPAAVRVTETHLEVHARLADLPIETRLAGLDRNPGWIPATGRFIAFYFE